MKSTTCFAERTNQKTGKYLCRRRRLESLARLLASCQLRNFPLELTENIFAVFDQSSHAIYFTWYRLLQFFLKLTSIISFMV